MSLIWSYGVLTVPSRAETLLPRTLASLAAGGFTAPRLFVDGARDARFESIQYSPYPITYRGENIRTFGNWVLALWELFLRNPHADRYALFEDDFVTYRNLKEYLDVLPFPSKAYLNLYLHPWNKSAIPIPQAYSEHLKKGIQPLPLCSIEGESQTSSPHKKSVSNHETPSPNGGRNMMEQSPEQ